MCASRQTAFYSGDMFFTVQYHSLCPGENLLGEFRLKGPLWLWKGVPEPLRTRPATENLEESKGLFLFQCLPFGNTVNCGKIAKCGVSLAIIFP